MLVLGCGCAHLPEEFNWGTLQILGWTTPWMAQGVLGPGLQACGGEGQGRWRSCPGQASAPRRVAAGCAADPEGAAGSLPALSGLMGGWDPTFGFWPLSAASLWHASGGP